MFTLIAQTPGTATGVMIDLSGYVSEISPINDRNIAFSSFLNSILFVGALLTFGYLLWGGIDWITSGGDSGKVESARKKITQAIIGLVVLASVFAVFFVIQSFLGLNIISKPVGPSASSFVPAH